eukprot:CAMPEP_0184480814 /NCGR_PEP_ID=MMETSP0113_2-20130426/2322_1 /TAXON_ID=91329 /ORGANISM="Norrisiella sphaerica, Strain BC52" /LENGTH=544 /DNA_ID=CAMNT_0026859541 /DNA_START=93 /DNA_END=1727 /DNA_ORIENTATION=+
MSKKAVAIHWFRKGLRLHDNPALMDACKGALLVYPLFILDPYFAKPQFVGQNRYNFLLESLRDIDNNLRQRYNSRLYVVQGKPHEVLPKLFEEWKVTRVTWESDTEPYARDRDNKIFQLAKDAGVEAKTHVSHTLYDPEAILAKNKGQSTTSYSAFNKLISRLGPPPQPLDAPKKKELPEMLVERTGIDDGEYTVPKLEELGYPSLADPNPCPFRGGESAALERLEMHLKRKKWIATFEKPKTKPNALEPDTTVLSPYLKFGCLSSRKFWLELQNIYEEYKSHSKPPVSLEGQLYWREFFYLNSYATPNFHKMEGNPICRQIPWEENKDHLKKWEMSETGYPFVDAIMTQLRETGWIHHLARHMVACFLTRGDLWISWEEGAKVFDRYLLDADYAVNHGNWMWLSCSCYFYQFFRCYSPVSFGKKTDKNGDYIRKWIPALKKYPAKYIYEPWKAPLSVQKSCGCVIGKDYPKPIIEDHTKRSKENMSKMKAAYDAHKAGKPLTKAKEYVEGDKKGGTLRKLFEGSGPEQSRSKNSTGTKKAKKA